VRETNEDRYLVREERRTTLLAVADGVGGEAGGEMASDAAIEALATRFFGASPGVSESDALAGAMRGANDAVLSRAGQSGQQGAASTLVAAAVAGTNAIIGNLGDSRAYLLRRGEIRRLTADHSGDYPSSITRFVGDPRGVQPDVFVETIRPGDRLLLCSDGLTRHVPDAEIATHATANDLRRAVDSLVDLAKARGGEDNITVVLFAARSRFGFADARRDLVSVILGLMIALVIAGSIAAVLFASGGYPSAR
jgi:protein phosphatase